MTPPDSTFRMALRRKQHDLVARSIDLWRDNKVIDQQTASRLHASLAVASFDWRRTARYAFVVSIVCLVVAMGALLADEVLMDVLLQIFGMPAAGKSAFFALLSAVIFWQGLELKRRSPHRAYRNEAVFFIGVLALAAAVAFLGIALDSGSGHYSLLLLIAALLYALLGLWFPSKLVWVFGLLSLGAWMGAETGYASGQGAYFLGMNYPLRFVVFGAALTALGVLGGGQSDAGSGVLRERLALMGSQTQTVGLLHLFVALWILSIFGNYGEMDQWRLARQCELLHWSALFGLAAVGAIWHGLRRDDGIFRGFGLTFLFINLYTRFFEYFWDSVHKAVFFLVLAVSFWLVGSKAESLWSMGRRSLPAQLPAEDQQPE